MAKEMMDTREVSTYLNINEKLVYKLLKGKNAGNYGYWQVDFYTMIN